MLNPIANFYGSLKIEFSRFRLRPFLPRPRINLQHDLTKGILKDISFVKSQRKFFCLLKIAFSRFSQFQRRASPPVRGLNLPYDLTNAVLKYIFYVMSQCKILRFPKIAFSRFRHRPLLPGPRLNLQYDITNGPPKDIF